MDDIEALLSMLRSRLLAFTATRARDEHFATLEQPLEQPSGDSGQEGREGGVGGNDGVDGDEGEEGVDAAQSPAVSPRVDPRIVFIARYRDGQRRVLEEAVATLEETMEGFEEG